MNSEHLGEVIAAHSTAFRFQLLNSAQNNQSREIPPLGSLVRVPLEETDLQILGLVFHVETTSVDSVHRPVALNLTRQELREQQPQIFELLTTEVLAIPIGYREKRHYYQYAPPYPPHIHDFVYPCSALEVQEFTERLFFLRHLLTHPQIYDEVIAAFIRHCAQIRQDRGFLQRAGRELSNLLKDNYERLVSITQRMQ